ncbi:SDR family NAD(P)-dependent oxidoreductase [Labrys sp. KB_33_2]|uniref:SDR family NAD(P)-dependent oxidoreductase n=1 Tax=Labrys sp. KB_33_2 TaxID=3237479 RepID=UPI003F91F578
MTCGTIDVLVNNAGVLSVHKVEDIEPDAWDRMYDVNTKGTFMVTKTLLGHFRQRKAGARYCSCKAAVISFTHILAMEVGLDGITVNAVCPGIIDIDMGRNNYRDEESLKKVIEKTTLGRLGYPEDVVGSVAFFASDDASFITGQALNVCGGIIFH